MSSRVIFTAAPKVEPSIRTRANPRGEGVSVDDDRAATVERLRRAGEGPRTAGAQK
jgi:hypothetical protein